MSWCNQHDRPAQCTSPQITPITRAGLLLQLRAAEVWKDPFLAKQKPKHSKQVPTVRSHRLSVKQNEQPAMRLFHGYVDV